tara:strand:+ start:2305 stop:2769 length:465 start_codon:yes stop_codon:yes gene_type:complete
MKGKVRTLVLNEGDATFENTAGTDVVFSNVDDLFVDDDTDMYEIELVSYSISISSDTAQGLAIVSPTLLQPYSWDTKRGGSSQVIALVNGTRTSGTQKVLDNSNAGTSFKVIVKRPSGNQLQIRLENSFNRPTLLTNVDNDWTLVFEVKPYKDC